MKLKWLSAGMVLFLLASAHAEPTKDSPVTVRVDIEKLNGLPDGWVDDLCKATHLIWATVPTKENSAAQAAACSVAMSRRKASGKTLLFPESLPLSK